MAKLTLIIIFLGISSFYSCVKSGYNEAIVYNNEFKSGSTEKLKGAILYKNEGELFIGRYNKGGFTINLDNLPAHKAIQIIAEPYFHDTWDGNNYFGDIDGPDSWEISVDGNQLLFATFSNTPCNSLYCMFQSYPVNYGLVNNPPRTGSIADMPSVCHGGDDFRTSVYKIDKTIRHNNSNLTITFRDYLIQKNVYDQLCDESWSMRSLTIKVINIPF